MSLLVDVADRARPISLRWPIMAGGAGVLVGGATAVDPKLGLGIAVALGVVIAILLRPSSLLIVLVASVFLELIKIGGLTITRVIAPIALIVVVASAVKKENAIRVQGPLIWAFAYSIWALASGFWSVSVGGTTFLLQSLAIALVYMLCFASLLTTRRDLERVLVALSALSLVLGVLSILAFIRHPLFGFSLLQEGRVQGATGDPSFFAATQLIALPLVLVLAANTQRTLYRNALYLVALVNLGSVLSTVSRGGVISLVAVMLLLMVMPARTMFRSPAQKRVALAALLVGGSIFFAHYSADLTPRLETIYSRSSDQTGSGRLAIWPAAWDAFEERPFTGIGYGAFVETSIDRIYATSGANITGFNVHREEVHNVYLGTAAELGLIGLVAFLGLLVSTFVSLRRTARRAREAGADFVGNVANALVVGLASWCVGSLFIETETSRPLWILVGITLALPKLIPERTSPSPR
jgi:putative inorganic carbon (hco3(-)) transporter